MKASSLLFVLLATTGIAQAQSIVPKLNQDGRKGDMTSLAHEQAQDKFNIADANKDERISQDEASKTLSYIAEHFDRCDKDGQLTWEEFVGYNRWKKE